MLKEKFPVLEQRADEAEKEALEAVAEFLGEPKVVALWHSLAPGQHDIDPETRNCKRCRVPETAIWAAREFQCPPKYKG